MLEEDGKEDSKWEQEIDDEERDRMLAEEADKPGSKRSKGDAMEGGCEGIRWKKGMAGRVEEAGTADEEVGQRKRRKSSKGSMSSMTVLDRGWISSPVLSPNGLQTSTAPQNTLLLEFYQNQLVGA